MKDLLDGGSRTSDTEGRTAMTNEMTTSRLNILRKGLIAPEIDQLQRSFSQKIQLNSSEIKNEIQELICKNEFYIREKLTLIDEIML